MARTSGDLVAEHLIRRKLNRSELARELGVRPSYVAQVIAGVRPVPKDKVQKWATALALQGPDREDFLVCALLAHCPPEIQELVTKLRGDRKA